MNIQITADETSDAKLLNAFCLGTGWTSDSGKSRKQWIRQKIMQFISDRARVGYVTQLSKDKLTPYISSIQSAREQYKSEIQQPTVTIS